MSGGSVAGYPKPQEAPNRAIENSFGVQSGQPI